jgi:hypothetical protein
LRIEGIPDEEVIGYAIANPELAVQIAKAHPGKACEIATELPKQALAIAQSVPSAAVEVANRLHEPVRPRIIGTLSDSDSPESLEQVTQIIRAMGNRIIGGIRAVSQNKRDEVARRVHALLTDSWHRAEVARNFPDAFSLETAP